MVDGSSCQGSKLGIVARMCLLLNQKPLVAQRSGMHEIGCAWARRDFPVCAPEPGHFLRFINHSRIACLYRHFRLSLSVHRRRSSQVLLPHVRYISDSRAVRDYACKLEYRSQCHVGILVDHHPIIDQTKSPSSWMEVRRFPG
jgi:hypothetical protein